MSNLFPIAATLALATAAAAVPNHGFDFRTVGDPGNPATNPALKHPFVPRPLGAVDYEYRLATTEVTYAQQLEFLNAYGANYVSAGNPIRSWGDISLLGFSGGVPLWELREGRGNRPGEMSPRLWARFTNWLNNDKALTADAFESGAYDTSTFGEDENGDLTDQMTRSEGARFWIPSIDEWVKGGYWDPNRHGEGEGGYWLYPNSSDTPLVPGLPEEGGETNAAAGSSAPRDVGSYPDTQTPWGLLDYSGGEAELAERISSFAYFSLGSRAEAGNTSNDRLGEFFFAAADLSGVSLRLASAVPAPGATALLLLGVPFATRRR